MEYENWNRSIEPFDESIHSHYLEIMCLKATPYGPSDKKATECSSFLDTSVKLNDRENLKHLCVLPKGHSGKCKHKFNCCFIKCDQSERILSSLDLAIYSSPGNDDYVYKNRASRLHGNLLSNSEEKKIRDKTIKKKCAIPLKDATTPLLLAQAALDWMTYLLFVPGVIDLLDPDYVDYGIIINYFMWNKEFLINYYESFNRVVFDKDGNTICCITRHIFRLDDIADLHRDIRVDIRDSDLQMGHNIPRSDNYITVRGCNLLPMSRRGNLIIGEKKFTEDIWIDELKSIVSIY